MIWKQWGQYIRLMTTQLSQVQEYANLDSCTSTVELYLLQTLIGQQDVST